MVASDFQGYPHRRIALLITGWECCYYCVLCSPMQYTCITASERYVALGANTGGVYCFHRDGLKYIRILANRVSG